MIIAEKKSKLTGHTGSLYALEIFNTSFIAGGSDKLAVKWLCGNTEGDLLARSLAAIYSLKFLDEKNLLLIGQGNGGIHVIDLQTAAEIKLLQFHKSSVFEIVKHAENYYSLGGDGCLSVFNNDFALTSQIKLSEGKLRSMAIKESQFLIADSAGRITVMNDSFIPEYQWQAHSEGFGVNKVCYFPGAPLILSGSRDAHLNIYNSENFKLEQSIPAHTGSIYDIAFHESGKIFATASRDKTVKLWNASTFDVISRLDESYGGHKYSVNKLLWMGDTLISTGDDRTIICWNISIS